MKRRFAIIMAALLIAAMAGCSQSGTSSTAEQSTVQSSADSSVAESAESEISEAESSVVSEVTSTESSEEKSETSAAESSENKSKTESSKPKNEESSKKETSKAETSKTETSTPVESSNPSKKPEESSTPSKKPEESSTPSSTPKQEVKATGITLDLSSLSLTSGSTQELNAYILWSNGTSSYQGITWSTSNNGVAAVSSSGYVTAKSAGTATITASYGSYSKSCTVTVKAAQVSQPSGGGNGGNGGTQTQPSQPSGGGNSGNGGSGNGGSGNGGSGGQTSKPSGGNNGGGSSGNNGSNNGGSSDNGGSGSTQTYVPFNKSTHKKVYSPKGYEMYELPEIVEYINVYRRQLGLSDVKWYDNAENREAAISEYNNELSEEELGWLREAYGNIYFDANGKFNVDKYFEYEEKKTTRAALEYCLDTKTLQHGGQHESMINGIAYDGNVKRWVDKIKTNSPMHWDILMKPKLRTIYWVVYVGAEGVTYSVN